MAYQPNFKQLGNLELIEVYIYYDKPLLVSVHNELDHRYMGILIDDQPSVEKWLYVGVSPTRFDHIRSGFLDLYTAFAQSESGTAFIASVPYELDQTATMEVVFCEQLSPDILPEPGEKIIEKTATLPKLSDNLVLKAQQAKRVFVRFHVEFVNQLRTEAPIKYLGEVLVSIQDLLNAIGQSKKERATKSGVIPKNILVNNEMAFSGAGGGSFEIELASVNYVDLLDESDVADSVETLSNLLAIGADSDRLRDTLKELEIRVSSRYLEFLESIVKDTKETTVEWATPNKAKRGRATITTDAAKAAIAIINSQELETPTEIVIIGELVGASLLHSRYELTVNDRESYQGKISPDAVEIVRGAVLGQKYVATIKRVRTSFEYTGAENVAFDLINLEPLSNNFPPSENR